MKAQRGGTAAQAVCWNIEIDIELEVPFHADRPARQPLPTIGTRQRPHAHCSYIHLKLNKTRI